MVKWSSGRQGRFRRGLLLLLVGVVGWIVLAGALDQHGTSTRPTGRYDAIVVLGCRVGPDGAASPALARRTRHAVALWRAGKAPRIVFTGGVGEHPPSEAEAAAKIARDLGVPHHAILMENASTSTEENAQFAAEQLGADRRVLVVTDSYHVFRSERVFARRFAEARAVGSLGARSVRVRGALREVLAVVTYVALGRMG